MAKITKEELHDILMKPQKDCNGYDLHVRHLWNEKDYTELFRATGIYLDEIKDLTDYRNFVDITHSQGTWAGFVQMIETTAKCAIAAGADGIFLETHPQPKEALSDANSMLQLTEVRPLLEKLIKIHNAL